MDKGTREALNDSVGSGRNVHAGLEFSSLGVEKAKGLTHGVLNVGVIYRSLRLLGDHEADIERTGQKMSLMADCLAHPAAQAVPKRGMADSLAHGDQEATLWGLTALILDADQTQPPIGASLKDRGDL